MTPQDISIVKLEIEPPTPSPGIATQGNSLFFSYRISFYAFVSAIVNPTGKHYCYCSHINQVISAAPTGRHNGQLMDNFDEIEVASKGLPPPRPWPSCAVEVEVDVGAIAAVDDVDDVDTPSGLVANVEVLVGKSEVDTCGVVKVSPGGAIVKLVMVVAVDCIGVVRMVELGMRVKEPTVCDGLAAEEVVTRAGTVVCRTADVVLVVCGRVTSFRKHACMTRVPC